MRHIRFYSLVLSSPAILFLSGIAIFLIKPLWSVWGLPVGWLTALTGWLLQLVLLAVIACPTCKKSPYMFGRPGSFAGFFGKPFPDVICSSCGFDLRNGCVHERSAKTQIQERSPHFGDAD
ncbi:hypothetical protein [Brevundimonas nasdae]|uniref:hypothetical protein n=1 Tax=Brevundimonas nasdae TaxID=172043 RepID=UPI003F692BEB